LTIPSNERIRSLADAFADVCERGGAAFVSAVEPLLASRAWMTQVAAGDGAHPAAEGYKVLSDLVIAAGWADWLRGESSGWARARASRSTRFADLDS
jgi:acyl-CoA thioesterase I